MIGELAALGAAVSWTISALFYRKTLEGAKPISANIIRLSVTGGLLLLVVVIVGRFEVLTSFSMQLFVLALVSGIIGLGVGDSLYLTSLKSIGVSRAVPLTCIYPLFSLLWAVLVFGEQITVTVALGAVVIVLGVLFLSRGSQADAREGGRSFFGVVVAIATALLWSVSISLMNLAVREAPDLDNAFMISVVRVATIGGLMLAVSPVVDRKLGFLRVRWKTAAAAIIGGVFALGLGWFLLAYSFTLTSQAISVPISSTTPLFSTLAAVFLLREKASIRNALGSIMIVLGIFLLFLA